MYVCCILLLVTQASSFTSASPEMTTIETDIEFVKLCALVVFLSDLFHVIYVLYLYVVWNSGITICTLGSYPMGRMM